MQGHILGLDAAELSKNIGDCDTSPKILFESKNATAE